MSAASHRGHIDVVEALIDAGCDLNITNRYGQGPLSVARNTQIVSLLTSGMSRN